MDCNKGSLKKKSNEKVDVLYERLLDPKYKTEICRKFEESRFCPYGNKCRFAHGKEELFSRTEANYKKKKCKSFHNQVSYFCVYGSRCLFQHSCSIEEIDQAWFSHQLSLIQACFLQKSNLFALNRSTRLEVFRQIDESNKENMNALLNKACFKELSSDLVSFQLLLNQKCSVVNYNPKRIINDYTLSTNHCSPVTTSPQKDL